MQVCRSATMKQTGAQSATAQWLTIECPHSAPPQWHAAVPLQYRLPLRQRCCAHLHDERVGECAFRDIAARQGLELRVELRADRLQALPQCAQVCIACTPVPAGW